MEHNWAAKTSLLAEQLGSERLLRQAADQQLTNSAGELRQRQSELQSYTARLQKAEENLHAANHDLYESKEQISR